MIFDLWCEMLERIDSEVGLSNLNEHILISSYFPTIADIAKQPTKGVYDNHIQLAHENALQLEESRKHAVPMPDYIKRRWIVGD